MTWAGQFFYTRIAFHMVRMSVTAKDNLDVVKSKPQVLNQSTREPRGGCARSCC